MTATIEHLRRKSQYAIRLLESKQSVSHREMMLAIRKVKRMFDGELLITVKDSPSDQRIDIALGAYEDKYHGHIVIFTNYGAYVKHAHPYASRLRPSPATYR